MVPVSTGTNSVKIAQETTTNWHISWLTWCIVGLVTIKINR